MKPMRVFLVVNERSPPRCGSHSRSRLVQLAASSCTAMPTRGGPAAGAGRPARSAATARSCAPRRSWPASGSRSSGSTSGVSGSSRRRRSIGLFPALERIARGEYESRNACGSRYWAGDRRGDGAERSSSSRGRRRVSLSSASRGARSAAVTSLPATGSSSRRRRGRRPTACRSAARSSCRRRSASSSLRTPRTCWARGRLSSRPTTSCGSPPRGGSARRRRRRRRASRRRGTEIVVRRADAPDAARPAVGRRAGSSRP